MVTSQIFHNSMAPHDGFQSGRTITLTLIIGSGGALLLGIQPLLLETLLAAGRLDPRELGWVATGEVLGMAVGILLGVRTLWVAGRLKVATAGLVMAAANLMTLATRQPEWILAVRILAGLSEGVLFAVAVLSISYGKSPGRLNAAFLTIAAVPQILFAYLIPTIFASRFGPDAGFKILAGAGLVCSLLAFFAREQFAPEAMRPSGPIDWTPAVLLALVATLLTAGASGACWSYIGPMAALLGVNQSETGVAVSIATTCSLVGSLLVAVAGWRLSLRHVLLVGVIVQAGAVMAILRSYGAIEFTVALGFFGFVWQALMPFAMDLIVLVDSSRATAPFVLPLYITGFSLGPFLASNFVEHSVTGAYWVATVGFLAAFVTYLGIFRGERALQASRNPE